MRIWTQKSASIQKRTSPLKLDDLAEKSEKDTVSNLAPKAPAAARPRRRREPPLPKLRRSLDVITAPIAKKQPRRILV